MKNEELLEIELKTLKQIRNYLMNKGYSPSIRDLAKILGYSSPRSASLIIDKLIEKGFLRRKTDGSLQIIRNLENDPMRAQTIDIPLIGTVACGTPILAQENIEAMIPVSIKIAKPPNKYFFLRAKGNSMNKAKINDGDFVLVKRQITAKNGDIVVALIDDEATIKEFYTYNNHIVLKPRSTNKKYQPIVLTNDFRVQGIVVTSMPDI